MTVSKLGQKKKAAKKPNAGKSRPRVNRAWTIMVYMTPDTSLAPFAIACMDQMLSADSAKHFDLVVQFHPASGEDAVRTVLKHDDPLPPLPISGPHKNPGDPEVLFGFLREVSAQFPASHYMLILWGHSLGFNFGREADPTTAQELAEVLKRFSTLRGGALEILGCDACRMSKFEIAAALQGSVDLIVASQIGIPLTSWPYKQILNAVAGNSRITPEQFGRQVIDIYCARYKPRGVTLSMLALDRGGPVFIAVEELAQALLAAMDGGKELENVAGAIKDTSRDEVEPMIDLQDFCRRLKSRTSDSLVRTSATKVVRLLDSGFIAKQGRRGPDVGHFRGVGIYVPRVLYDPALQNQQLKDFFRWKQQHVDFSTQWSQVIARLVSASQ